MSQEAARVSRRSVLRGATAAGGGFAVASCGRDETVPAPEAAPESWSATGVETPFPPQTAADFRTYLAPRTQAGLSTLLEQATSSIAELMALSRARSARLSVTVGAGLRLLQDVEELTPVLYPLPRFGSDAFGPAAPVPDLSLLVSADEGALVDAVVRRLDGVVRSSGAVPCWSQAGVRHAVDEHGVARNVIGFHDGIAQPHDDDLSRNVWLQSSNPALEGATIQVARRMLIDVPRFERLSVAQQEATIGRRADGVPLSGGGPRDDVDLHAKTADGRYLIPVDAHVRQAHPAAAGQRLMLRRGFSWREGERRGLLFVSYQSDVSAFVQTQYRLDAGDALMRYARTLASGVFLALPPGTDGRALGAGLVTAPSRSAGARG